MVIAATPTYEAVEHEPVTVDAAVVGVDHEMRPNEDRWTVYVRLSDSVHPVPARPKLKFYTHISWSRIGSPHRPIMGDDVELSGEQAGELIGRLRGGESLTVEIGERRAVYKPTTERRRKDCGECGQSERVEAEVYERIVQVAEANIVELPDLHFAGWGSQGTVDEKPAFFDEE